MATTVLTTEAAAEPSPSGHVAQKAATAAAALGLLPACSHIRCTSQCSAAARVGVRSERRVSSGASTISINALTPSPSPSPAPSPAPSSPSKLSKLSRSVWRLMSRSILGATARTTRQKRCSALAVRSSSSAESVGA